MKRIVLILVALSAGGCGLQFGQVVSNRTAAICPARFNDIPEAVEAFIILVQAGQDAGITKLEAIVDAVSICDTQSLTPDGLADCTACFTFLIDDVYGP